MKKLNFARSCSIACLCVSLTTYGQDLATSGVERISVVSSRIPQPLSHITTSVSILEKQDIDGQLSYSLADVMRRVPGVGVSNSGGLGKNTALRIRGEESFRTRLYLDGIELSDPSAPQVGPVFDDLLTPHVGRIEVLRGTQGLAYGADAGGIISVSTQPPEGAFAAQATAGFSRYATRSFNGSLSKGKHNSGFFIGVSHLTSDGFNAQTADSSNESDGYENSSIHIKTNFALADALSTQLVVRHVDADNQYDGCYDSVTFALTHDCASKAQNTTARLSLDYQSHSGSHQIAVKQTDVQRRFFSNDVFAFTNQGRLQEFDYLGNSQLHNVNLVYGAQFKQERIADGEDREQKGAFVEALTQLSPSLIVNTGVRFDDNDTFGQHTSYRAGVAKLLDVQGGQVKLRASWGTGFRAPSLFEQSYNDGAFAFGAAAGLQLTEETSQGADIGAQYQADNGAQVEVVLFRQRIENEIIFDPVGFTGYLQGEGQSRSKGLELNSAVSPLKNYNLWLNYTLTHSQDSQAQQRLRRPKHMANIGIDSSYLGERLQFSLFYRWAADAIDIGGQPLDDYSLVSLSAQFKISPSFSLKAGISNLFNQNYEEVAGFNSAQRDFSLSLTYTLP